MPSEQADPTPIIYVLSEDGAAAMPVASGGRCERVSGTVVWHRYPPDSDDPRCQCGETRRDDPVE